VNSSEPVPPPFTISIGATLHPAHELGPAFGDLLDRVLLHPLDHPASPRPVRRLIADPGDLPFVGHDRDQFELVPAGDLLGKGDALLGAADR